MRRFAVLTLICLMVFMVGCGGGGGAQNEQTGNDIIAADTEGEEQTKTEEPQDAQRKPDETPTEEVPTSESKKESVPREYKNALKSAENYLSVMPFSELGLYEQLTSEYGDKYPAEAARYAIENVKVNYKEQALRAALNYLDIMPMSDQELFDQLTSEYGEKYTDEQARYAIDNLPD